MLRKTRIIIASVFFTGITLLFLDVTGTLHLWLGWMAKIQLLPAALAANTVVVAFLLLLTILFGRIYCSVICPLGIMQDIISWIHTKQHKKFRYRFQYKPERKWLRNTVFLIFILCLILGIQAIVGILAPYSSYGRIVENIFSPIYGLGNNLIAFFAERLDSYAFYSTDVWIKSIPTFAIAVLMFATISFLAWKNGREWCNSICPVGTLLGVFSKYSIFVPKIDSEKCRRCGLCGRACKASCINMDEHKIDYSRCVVCMDCIDNCNEGAISYGFRYAPTKNRNKENKADAGRRGFLLSSLILAGSVAKAQENSVKERLSPERTHKIPQRKTGIVPPGAISLKNFYSRCTACQLCVNTCPNNVLRPSSSLNTLMQPEMSFERGYCRPECTKCSDVCPAGAIISITPEEKSSIQIGHAVVNPELCVVMTDSVKCGNCGKHCPSGAIIMVPSVPGDKNSLRIPSVNEEVCIGCGACENLCPASPYPAIHVEGHQVHKNI